jgi:hypothetical protein
VTFGQFAPEYKHALDDEALLLKVVDGEVEGETIMDRHQFHFENDRLFYGRDVNSTAMDTELEHTIEASELNPAIAQSWSETLFYGVGNKNM